MNKIFLLLVITIIGLKAEYSFEYKNLINAYAAYKKDFNYYDYAGDYIYFNNKDYWKKNRNDEFIFEDKKQEVIIEMKNKASEHINTNLYVIHTGVEFGKYNFKNQEFPIETMLTKTSMFKIGVDVWNKPRDNKYPNSFQIIFNNPKPFASIKMLKDKAKSFLENRKNNYGKIDRTINTDIFYKIIKLYDEKTFLVDIVEVKYNY